MWNHVRRAWMISLFVLPALASAEVTFPPKLPGGKQVVTDRSKKFLRPTAELKPGVKIAQTPPEVDFLYYPGQDYPGNPWSAWGDGLVVGETYYSAIGDHKAPGGNAFVYRYDTAGKRLRQLVDLRRVLQMPDGHYTPGKIHSRIDLGDDGWLYFSTHRGSTRVTTDEYHYRGDWILRCEPEQNRVEIVAQAPLARQCMPTSVLDPVRRIFYAGTADGDYRNKRVQFLAYDTVRRKLLYHDDRGPRRYMIFARSTGRVYFVPTEPDGTCPSPGRLVRFDPEQPGRPVPIDAQLGLRSATQETPQGIVYTVDGDNLWAFDVRKERAKHLGPAVVGGETYVTSIDADPKTGRYLYYIAGAHGGSYRDGTPLVQYDVNTRSRKVIAFLHPFYSEAYGFVPMGTYSSAVSPEGDKVYLTVNGNCGGGPEGRIRFNTCALLVVHVPESERQP